MKLPFAPSLRQGIKGCSGRLISLGGLRCLGSWRGCPCNTKELRHLLTHRAARFFPFGIESLAALSPSIAYGLMMRSGFLTWPARGVSGAFPATLRLFCLRKRTCWSHPRAFLLAISQLRSGLIGQGDQVLDNVGMLVGDVSSLAGIRFQIEQ